MKSSGMTFGAAPMATMERPAPAPVAPAPRLLKSENSDFARFTPVVTLVLWLGCSVVGVLGFAMPYGLPQALKAQPEPVQVEMLNVEMTDAPVREVQPTVANALTPPPPPEAVSQPQLPQPIAVAVPSPAVAFAVPVEGPVRVVEAAQASHATAPVKEAVATTAPAVQVLTFGHGEGKQPRPDYPPRSQREGQEGVVNVRFTVGDNGRVLAVEAVEPSPWPLLNESALRTIRTRWQFSSGVTRAYQVAIRFVMPR